MEQQKCPHVPPFEKAPETLDENAAPTPEGLARRARSIALLEEMGLPFAGDLPPMEAVPGAMPRAPEKVAQRCIASALCAIKGEMLGMDQPFIDEIVRTYGAEPYFSPEESAFIRCAAPRRKALVNFCWGYECVHVFLWALGHLQALKPPNVICDVPYEMGLIRDTAPGPFIDRAKLRSTEALLDMADLYYLLHWAAVALRLKGKPSAKVDEGIVRERHRALTWLVRPEDMAWDEMACTT